MNSDSYTADKELAKILVPPPRSGEDVCSVCRSWKFPAEGLCNNCSQVIRELKFPCRTIIPISLYRKPSLLRDWLKFYKPRIEGFKPEYRAAIEAILGATLVRESESLENKIGGWDYIVIVPSTQPSGVHPLQNILRRLGLDEKLSCPLARRIEIPLGHRVMSDYGYRVANEVRNKKFLLVDDVYTTGARSQSAASALRLAGAHVAAIVVIGRRINVEYNEFAAGLWDRQQGIEFSFKDVFS